MIRYPLNNAELSSIVQNNIIGVNEGGSNDKNYIPSLNSTVISGTAFNSCKII